MKIGILSDTHGLLKEHFMEELKTCSCIIHAGDIGSQTCYQTLKDLNIPLYMVKGNCDHGVWSAYLPETLSFMIQDHMFYLIHDKNQLPFELPLGTEYVISGHTHCYELQKKRGITYLNPGSASASRSGGAPSMVILTIEGKDISTSVIH